MVALLVIVSARADVLLVVDINVVLVVVNVVVRLSHPLQVSSHLPGTLEHSECLNIVWHCSKANSLRLFAHRSVVLVVVLVEEVVLMLVVEVVVVVSQSLHVLAQCSKTLKHRLTDFKSWHCNKGNLFFLL